MPPQNSSEPKLCQHFCLFSKTNHTSQLAVAQTLCRCLRLLGLHHNTAHVLLLMVLMQAAFQGTQVQLLCCAYLQLPAELSQRIENPIISAVTAGYCACRKENSRSFCVMTGASVPKTILTNYANRDFQSTYAFTLLEVMSFCALPTGTWRLSSAILYSYYSSCKPLAFMLS